MEWIVLYNLLFPLIDNKPVSDFEPGLFMPVPENPDYYSGSRFIRTVQEYDPSIPHYKEYYDQRVQAGKSTSRRDFFYDILKEQPQEKRIRIIQKIVEGLKAGNEAKVSQIKAALLGNPTVVLPEISAENWNAERIQRKFSEIDEAIQLSNFGRAVTLSYTCFEGLLKSFIRKNIPEESELNEIVKMSRVTSAFLKGTGAYPDEVCNSIITIGATINVSRNKFSEAHFNGEAQLILAVYIRDLTNTVSKLLVYHMR